LRYKITNDRIPAHLKQFEYNIGLQLSDIFQLPKTQNTPHAAFPSTHYKKYIKIIEERMITKEEILKGKIKEIYIRVKTTTVRNIVTQSIFGATTPNYKWIHHALLPNYLKTFNYKLANNALPVQPKFKLNIPELNPYCFLCKTTYESDIHLFSKCVEIKALLHYVTRIYYNITKNIQYTSIKQ